MENIKEIISALDFMIWGYIVFKIWEYITPQREMKASEKYIEMLIVGLGIDKVSSKIIEGTIYGKTYVSIVIAVSSPFIFRKILKSNWVKRNIIKTLSPTSWDYYFSTAKYSLVKIHFKDGREPVIGWFGKYSYVSSYPHPQDIYIEAIYKLNGNILGPVKKNTLGILVRFEDVLYIEFIKKTDVNNQENGGVTNG